MRVAEIIGTVTLSRRHPSFQGARLRLARVLTLENLQEGTESTADPIAVWDELGAGLGDRIALSDGAEAAQPFRPEMKPVDAYNSAILDAVNL